ncbi:MAG TPA: hypothetical protein VFY63_16955 [Pseudorhizobium sp.]|nr:hypothetical protein [Pseudorhizobium sp.]
MTSPVTCIPDQPVEDERRIITRRRVTAAEFGGTAWITVSLPRISMHVAAIAEAGRQNIVSGRNGAGRHG